MESQSNIFCKTRIADLAYIFFQFYKRSVRKEYEQHRDEEVNIVNEHLQKNNFGKILFHDPKKWTKEIPFQDPRNYLDKKYIFRIPNVLSRSWKGQ